MNSSSSNREESSFREESFTTSSIYRKDEPDVVSTSSEEEDEGACAFAELKEYHEVRKLRSDCSGKEFRKKCLEKLEDCFSLSSLEVDLDDEFEQAKEDENDSEPNISVSRFAAEPRRENQDFIPPLPTSSERDVRRVVSKSELRDSWHKEQPITPTSKGSRAMEVDLPPSSIGKSLRESRWSSSSDRSMRQDALDILLDKVSSSYHDAKTPKDGSLSPPRRSSMVDCENSVCVHRIRPSYIPNVPRRGSAPFDSRWQQGARIPSDSLPSPARLRS